MIFFNRFQVLSVFLFCIISFVFVGMSAANETLNDQLIKAAGDGNISQVKTLLKQGADINAENDDLERALVEVSMNGHKDIVQLLKQYGATGD